MRAFSIARLYLRRTLHGRAVLISLVAMPLIFTWILGLAMADLGNGPPSRTTLLVVSDDRGNLDDILVSRLDLQPSIAVQRVGRYAALKAVDEGTVLGALLVPALFSERLQQRQDVRLELRTRTDDLRRVQVAEKAIHAAMTELASVIDAARVAVRTAGGLGFFDLPEAPMNPPAYFATSLALAARGLDLRSVEVVTRPVTRFAGARSWVPEGFEQSSPGMLVMFTMFLMLGGATVLVSEREQGTLRRLATMPVSRMTVRLGQTLGILAAGALQMAILLVAGRLLFGVPWGASPAALVAVAGSFALAVATGTLLLATLARTRAQAGAVRTLAVLVMTALGGSWWPLEIVPDWMQTVGHALPTAWAMDGFHDLVSRGLGIAEVVPEAGVLVAFAVLFFVLAVVRRPSGSGF